MSDDEALWRYHLERYKQGTLPQREEALRFLLAQGEAIVPWLLEELGKKREAQRETGQSERDVLHLAALLAELESPQALIPLLELDDSLGQKLLRRLEARAGEAEIRALLKALEHWTPSGVRAVTLGFTAQRVRVALAESLVRIAERTGSPLCHTAFSLIRVSMLVPTEFIALHQRLKTALESHALPIPAEKTSTASETLPVPSEARP